MASKAGEYIDILTSFSGPILLLQDGEVTLFPQLEGVVTTQDHLVTTQDHHLTTQDHHEILPLREAVIMNVGHILQVMTMVLGKLKMEKGMTSKLKAISICFTLVATL